METTEGDQHKEKFCYDSECHIQDLVWLQNQDKTSRILKACEGNDLKALQELATSENGLVSDSIRCQAWPVLLGISHNNSEYPRRNLDKSYWESLPVHPDEDQVKLDVNRSFIHYPHGRSSNETLRLRERLLQSIINFLRCQPNFSYFQGFHDICQVFMLVLHPESFQPAITQLSILRIRDFMLPTFSQALAQLHLILSIVNSVNPKLSKHLSSAQPYFALSCILTMFAHDVQEYDDITRIFDVLLSREAVFSIYMFAQIVLQRSDELFLISSDEPEILHSTLSKIPQPIEVEALISNTLRLYNIYPPEVLKGWESISRNSVMKTTRWLDQLHKQSLNDGHKFFLEQARELKIAEQRGKILEKVHKNWKLAFKVAFPVLIGIICYWYKDSPGISKLFKGYLLLNRIWARLMNRLFLDTTLSFT